MFRILLIISLILLAIPLFNKVASYTKNKVHDAAIAGEDLRDKAKNIGAAVKESVKELPQKIEDRNNGKSDK